MTVNYCCHLLLVLKLHNYIQCLIKTQCMHLYIYDYSVCTAKLGKMPAKELAVTLLLELKPLYTHCIDLSTMPM